MATLAKMTGADLAVLISKAIDEVHPAQQPYFVDEPTNDVLIDGRFNLDRLAELIIDRFGE